MHFATKLKDKMPMEGLKAALHRNMAGYEEARPFDYIHASDLTRTEVEYCPRAFALSELFHVKPKGQFIGTSLRYTFDMGRMLEHRMQNDWAKPYAVGIWKCNGCGSTSSFGAHPGGCKTCKSKHWSYQESRFKSPYCGASGGVDLLVNLPGNKKLKLVELKSMARDDFKVLKTPLTEHRMRTSLYLRLVEESDSPFKDLVDLNEGIVMYMCKGFGFKDDEITVLPFPDAPFSPFKEFVIKRDDSLTDHLVERARELDQWRKKTGGIPKGICPNSMAKRCKSCSVSKQCFSGVAPAGKKIYSLQ